MKFQKFQLLSLFIFFVLLFGFSLIFPKYLLATSGCCSGHQGVNCAAGPQANGNVICNDGWRNSSCSYASMVMCEGSTTPTVTAAPIIYTQVPTPKPTIKPVITPVPTPIKTSKPTATPTPTSSPEVQGASTQNNPTSIPSPTPTPAPLTTGGAIGALVFLAIIIGLPIWVVAKIVKRFRKPKTEI